MKKHPKDVLNDALRVYRDPDELAAFLAIAGHRGRRDKARECPVARWLQGECCKRGERVRVDSVSILLTTSKHTDILACLATPSLIRDFVARFDGGDYPELCVETVK